MKEFFWDIFSPNFVPRDEIQSIDGKKEAKEDARSQEG
jgi:hypothetical protein